MENSPELKAAPHPAASCASGMAGGGFNRKVLYIGLGIAAAAGLAFGWDWLVAVGASTLIISVLPCLLMCALGLCMRGKGHGDQGAHTTSPSPAAPDVVGPKITADTAPATAAGDRLA